MKNEHRLLWISPNASQLSFGSKSILSSSGFQVTTSGDAGQALDLIKREPPVFEVAVINLMNQPNDALDSIAALKSADADMEMMVLTADVPTGLAALRRGARQYFLPTVSEEEIQLQLAAAAAQSRARRAHTRLAAAQRICQASDPISFVREPHEVWQASVNRICAAAGAWESLVLWFDESQYPRILAAKREGELNPLTLTRREGISRRVLQTNQAEFIADTIAEAAQVNPGLLKDGVKAAACLPLAIDAKPLGVMWLHYSEKHHFCEEEMQALKTYAKRSALAYLSTKRMQELAHLHAASKALVSAQDVNTVLHEIVKSARQVLNAHYALLWPYDEGSNIFFPEDLVSDEIQEPFLERIRADEPKLGQITYRVLNDGYIAVQDITAVPAEYLGVSTREFLLALQIRSFQAIRLEADSKKLGVLYVDYKEPRGFSSDEVETLEIYAQHAALFLRQARLAEGVKRAHTAASAVADVLVTSSDVRSTLDSIARLTKKALDCDAVTLYSYDQETKKFGYPPSTEGLRHPERVARFSALPSNSIVETVFKRKDDDPLIILDARSDPNTRGRRFTLEEEIRSVVALSLWVKQQQVGVMFVNYRRLHRLTDDELTTIYLFAHQAAVAIAYAQQYNRAAQRASALNAVYESVKSISERLRPERTLSSVAEQAKKLVSSGERKGTCFSYVALVHGGTMQFVSASDEGLLRQLKRVVGEVDLKVNQRLGVIGRVVLKRESKLVPNVLADPDYIRFDPETQSQMTVPIKVGKNVIGAIGVEASELDAFSPADQQNLEMLAELAAPVIQRTQQIEALKRTTEMMTATPKREQLLNRISRDATELLQAEKGGIYELDPEAGVMTIVAVFNEPGLLGETLKLGDGMAGRLIKERLPVLSTENYEESEYRASKYSGKGYFGAVIEVPLVWQDKPIGVLFLSDQTGRKYTRQDEQLLALYADYAAIALGHSKFFARSETLLKALNVVAQAPSLDKALEGLAQTLVTELDHSFCRVFLLDNNRETLTVKAAAQASGYSAQWEWNPRLGMSFSLEEWKHETEFFGDGKARIVDCAMLDRLPPKRLAQWIELDQPLQSLLIVPLRIGTHYVGLLEVGEVRSAPLHAIRSEHRELAQLVADRISILIQRLKDSEDSKAALDQRRGETKALVAIAEESLKGNLGQTLSQIIEQIKKISRCDAVTLHEYDEQTQSLVYPPQMTGVKNPNATHRYKADPALSRVYFVAQRAAPYEVEDVTRDKIFKDSRFARDEGIKSLLGIPLRVAGQRVGVLFVNYREPHRFLRTELETIPLFATFVAIAIRDAQLHKRLEAINTFKEQLLYHVEHEMNGKAQTALNKMHILAAEDKIGPLALSPEQRKVFNRAYALLNRYVKEVMGLRSYVDIINGQYDARKESIPLRAKLEAYLEYLTEEMRDKNLALGVLPDPNLIIEADANLTAMVLSTLLENAVKYSPAGGRINVQCGLLNGLWQIHLDNQCVPQVAEIEEGTGLRLAKYFVEWQGGELRYTLEYDWFHVTYTLPQ